MDTLNQIIPTNNQIELLYRSNDRHTENEVILQPGQIGTIKKINDIFTAEAVAPSGEKMYLAMEPLGKDKNKWKVYRDRSTFICKGGDSESGGSINIGTLQELESRIHDTKCLKDFLAKKSDPNFWISDIERFNKLCTDLKDRKITPKKSHELQITPHASRGFDINTQTHMIYVSKVPITDYANFTSTQNTSFGEYVDCYGDLVMSVGTCIKEIEKYVENRGIFRNPLSVLEGGYGGISMMLHSFTCMVVQDYYPSVETFKVKPFGEMGRIFLRSLPKDQVTIDGVRGDKYQGEFIATIEKKVETPVAALASLHQAKERQV